MNRTKKKHIGFILLFCIGVLFGASPIDWGTSFVLAAEPDEDYMEAEARWQTAEDGEWHEGSFLKAVEDVYDGGTIELLSNVSLTGGISVNKPVRVRSYDISAPCTILNQTAEPKNEDNVGEIFTVKGGNFFLEHIILDGGREEGRIVYHPLISVTNGQLTLGAGAVLQNNENADEAIGGGGLRVSGSGIALMADGSKITGCKAKNGGGVEAAAGGMPCFVMYTGSLIENCQALDGGGVYVNKGGFLMMGGQIKGNQATGKEVDQGGGGVIAFHENSELRAAGGSITGNTSGSGGGGVYVYLGKIKVSGNTQITSNLKAGEASNVYLREGKVIEVTGDITSANIGVAASYGEGIFSSGWGTQMGEADPADCFKSDNAAYSVVIDDAAKEAKLVPAGEEPDPGPENPDPGAIKTETAVEEGAPKTEMLVTEAELTDMILTEAEKAEVEKGTDITIRLAISDADSTVTDQDKGVAEGARKEYTIGKYLDISLLKIIGDAQSNIRETTKMIRIKLEIPDDLKNKDSEKTRKYAILRVHEGVAEILNDLDTDPNTITIETNRFSTYAVLYNDTEEGGNTGEDDNQGGNTGGNGNQGGNTGGNDNQGGSTGGDDNQGGSTGGSDNSQSSGGNGDASGSAGADAAPTAPGAASNVEKALGSSSGAEKAAAGSAGANTPKAKDGEPKTGDSTAIELYATVAMIAGLSYLLLYFGSDSRGMTEEEKKEIVSKLIRWSRRGGRIYRLLALAAIFLVLVYYHSIGKKTAVNWKEVYEK